MYRPEKTGRAVRVRPLAEVLSGDATIRESTASNTSQSSFDPVMQIFAAGSNNVGCRFSLKHDDIINGKRFRGYGVGLTFPDDVLDSYHYQYTIGLMNIPDNIIAFPCVMYENNNPAVFVGGANVCSSKRMSMLPCPPFRMNGTRAFCVSDHYVEAGNIDFGDLESLADSQKDNYFIAFGVMMFNVTSAGININNIEVHCHASRYVTEQPTFDPATY